MSLIPGAISRKIARTGLITASNSPKILFGVGIVGVVGSTVLACRATLKLEGILTESKEELKFIETNYQDAPEPADPGRDITMVYLKTAAKIGREYGPALVVGGLSIAALTKSHNILTERNAALTAAYVALEKGFSEYRARVVDKYGEEADRDFRYGTRVEEIVDEKGKKKKVTRAAIDMPSIYAKWFDHRSSSWQGEDDLNWLFLHNMQNWCNDMLKARGHVTLNDVYDELGLERTSAGAVVGWVLNNNDGGDNYIDFGIATVAESVWEEKDFVKGVDGAILLDFNVDGIIYDKIDKPGKVDEIWELPQ